MNTPSAESILRELRNTGIYHLEGCLSYESFIELSNGLGEIIQKATVSIKETSTHHLRRCEAIDFHTDSPQASFIGWHCQAQDSEDGTSLLVDGLSAVSRLSDSDKTTLAQVFLDYPDLKDRQIRKQPLLKNEKRLSLYYAPWLVDEVKVSAFVSELRLAPQRKVRLKAGEALFIDNRRILHGREAISPKSRRHIERVWLGERRVVNE